MNRLISAFALALVLVSGASDSFGQNTEARTRVQEWAAAWSGLEPHEKKELTDAWRRAIEQYRGLPPERQEEWKRAAHDLVDFLQNLTPEQRAKARQFFTKLREVFGTLIHEQKQQLIRTMTDKIQQVQSLTPEQKQKLREGWERWVSLRKSRQGKS
jgi:hypothetical protein